MLLLKIWNLPSSSQSCQNDSFIAPMTAGSGNPDFWWHQLLPQVKPVLWVPQSCPRMHRLGRKHCPMLADKKSFKLFNSNRIETWSQVICFKTDGAAGLKCP